MKKVSIILILTMCLSLFNMNVSANNINVYVDKELVQLTDATGANVYPFIQDGTTYVPLRGVSEALDCDVVWDGKNKTVLIYKEMQSDNSVFRNNSDEIKLYVDNKLVELKDANGTIVKPFIKDGTTYVPLRGVSQALGCWVRWNGQARTVSVYMNTVPPEGVTLSENKPYELRGADTYYESEGQFYELDSVKYTNCFNFGYIPRGGVALFDLNGKYKKMTFDACKYANYNDEVDSTISFVVDGILVDTIDLNSNTRIKNFSIDLDYGLQLKIVAEGHYNVLCNTIFWGE